MMILGLAATAGGAGALLDPYSPERLVAVMGGVAVIAMALTLFAVRGMEGAGRSEAEKRDEPFLDVLRAAWIEPDARRFTIFVFVSMLAFSAQDLILEPFAGHVFGMTVGETTLLAAKQQMGVFFGMVTVAVLGSGVGGRLFGSLRMWTVLGCLGSGAALAGLAVGAFTPDWPLRANVAALGFANGMFATAAIGSMMALAGADGGGHEGSRMGMWGAAQAIAFGIGGIVATTSVDVSRALINSDASAYALVFSVEAGLFVVSAWLALGLALSNTRPARAARGPLHSDPAQAAPTLAVAGE